MRKIKKIVASVMIATFAFSAVGCKMVERTPESIQKTVLATVGKEKVTQGDLDKDLKSITESLKQRYGDNYAENPDIKDQLKELKKQYLNAIVNEKVVLQKAEELKLKPDEDTLNKEVDSAIQYYKDAYKTDEQFTAFLQQNDFTEDSFKEYQKNQAIVRYVQQDIVKDIEVTDSDIETYYNENKDKYTEGAGAVVSHILVADENTAKEVKSKLDKGEDFATVAAQYSTDTGTKDNGGSLGFIEYSSTKYVKEFMDGFKDLKEGEISAPVKSQYGYHIIKVTGVKTSDAVTPLDDVKEEIRSELLQQKQKDAFNSKIEEWKKDIKVKINEDKLK